MRRCGMLSLGSLSPTEGQKEEQQTMTRPQKPKRDQSRDKNRAEHHAELLMGLANQRKCEESRAACDDADAYSVEEFCRKNRISVQLFYKRPALMPDSFYVG